jgi:hypothetical protein
MTTISSTALRPAPDHLRPAAPATARPWYATARFAGLLYLLIYGSGIFAELGVRSRLIESGDPTATAANILDAPMLFRAGIAADIVMFLADVALAVVLYRLLAPVNRTLSMLAAAFRLAQGAVIGMNLLNMSQALRILDDADSMTAFGVDERAALALLSLDAHRYGYLLALAFFGVSTIAVGALAWSSRRMPRPLGVLLGLTGVGYLVDTAMYFMIPGYDGGASMIVLAPAFVAELWFALWLVTRGRRIEELEDRTGATT